MQVVVFIDGHHALFQELIPGWLTTKTSSRLKKTGSLAVLGHCYARDSQYKVTLPFAQAGTYHVVSHISWYQSKLLFSATMVIDCDADIRSSTSPSTKKFKPSTNRATPWTSSSLTRSHDSPSQVAPSLYLETQTAISVWIKRRFGDFLVWKNYIFDCLFASFPSHLRSPLLLLLLWWRLCRLLLLLRLLQRQFENILMANIIIFGTCWTKNIK